VAVMVGVTVTVLGDQPLIGQSVLIPIPLNTCAFCYQVHGGALGYRCRLHSYLSDLV